MDVLPELKRYLQQKQWKWRAAQQEGNIAIRTCPFCGRSKWKFWIHAQRTVYRCWHCDARGNLYKLKRELGDLKGGVVSAAHAMGEEKAKESKPISMKAVEKMHQRLLKSKRALEYLDKRGLGMAAIKHFKLGVKVDGGTRWLAIPHIAGGVCYNIKFRSLPPADKKFKRMKGRASVLFNADALADHDEILLCEAELDAMSFWQAGAKNVIGLTCGADTFLPEWYDLLADKTKITLVLDADSVGQQGARNIARRLGFDRCHNVMLPGHDANEVLQTQGAKELLASLNYAEQFEVHGVITAADGMTRCREGRELGEQGLLTPWRDFNRLLGPGWQPGDLVILSAPPKIGKTTLGVLAGYHLAQQGTPAMVYCLEMSIERLMEKLASHMRQKPVEELQKVDFAHSRYVLRQMPFYFVEPDWASSLKQDKVFDKIREGVRRHGVRYLLFDHLHFLCRSLQYITTEVGQVTRAFKLLAQELEITICLIAQPRKIEGDRPMRMADIKDSSAVPADADQIVIMHRHTRPAGFDKDDVANASDAEVLEPKTLLRVERGRFVGGGECVLWFDGECNTFYDWTDRPIQEY